jgi:hypothetical protein
MLHRIATDACAPFQSEHAGYSLTPDALFYMATKKVPLVPYRIEIHDGRVEYELVGAEPAGQHATCLACNMQHVTRASSGTGIATVLGH